MHASAETMGPDPRRPRALRLDHGFLRWGAFLIGLGAVPLAVQAGWLSEVGIDAAWPYWPLALVGIGVGLLVQSTPLAALGAILIGLSFGLPIGAAVGGSDGLPVACIGGPHGPAVGTTRSGTLVAGSSVEVTGGCGDLTVAAEPGTAWSVEGPSDVAIDDLPGRLQIRARPSLGGGDRSVAVTLPAGSLLDVRLTGVAGNLSASMPGADLTGFGAEMNFGRADVNLSGARLRGDLSVD
ncbi:MAG TPA: hypothetical protein VFW86_01510, partial [Candidatus Limnocylindrales bacterium]|nr:hypothetical protein [Candidatus Limnocylindrales bacterium]